MSGLTARPNHALFSHRATVKQKHVCVSSSCAVLGARLRVGRNCCWSGTRTRDSRGKGLVVVARTFRGGSRRQLGNPSPLEEAVDPALDIDSIRSPSVRLIDKEQKMVGIVSTSKAIEMAEDAELDLVIISRDGDPPVVRLVDYSKYKFEQQKRKKDQQKKSSGSHTDVKDLKMGCNIDIHDYNVRLRAAQKFLQDGRRVKLIVQCRGREINFSKKAFDLFDRYRNELKELGVLESETYGDRYMYIVLQPIKRGVKGQVGTNNAKKSDVKLEADKEPMTEQEPVIVEKPMIEVSSGV